MLPPNPKWSQLEAFSVPSLVSTLFAVPVCSKPVHWGAEVMFYFTQNFIHSWTNWVRLSKIIKRGIKTYDVKIPLSFKQKRQDPKTYFENSYEPRNTSLYFYTYVVKWISKPSRSIINRNLFTSNLTSNSTWHKKKLVEDATNDYNYIT